MKLAGFIPVFLGELPSHLIPGKLIPVIFRYKSSAKTSVIPETKSTTDWILK